jgi:hypothetical protein
MIQHTTHCGPIDRTGSAISQLRKSGRYEGLGLRLPSLAGAPPIRLPAGGENNWGAPISLSLSHSRTSIQEAGSNLRRLFKL